MEQIKQTAVKWLEAMVTSKLSQPMSANFKELFEQAKEMEKEQIIEAHNNGYGSGYMDEGISPEDFYNETYGGNK
jgi:hypothetical protein